MKKDKRKALVLGNTFDGHNSCGWGDDDKIILWDSNGTACIDMYPGDITWCRRVADLLGDSNNM